CPFCSREEARQLTGAGTEGGAPVPTPQGAVPTWLDDFVVYVIAYKDNGLVPRTYHAYGYEWTKLGTCNHIPVCATLDQLDAYFCGGSAQGSTHFGVGRESWSGGNFDITVGATRWRIPVAPVSQYLPTTGYVSPWAQGVVQTSAACAIQ